jgi:hypothetical protein
MLSSASMVAVQGDNWGTINNIRSPVFPCVFFMWEIQQQLSTFRSSGHFSEHSQAFFNNTFEQFHGKTIP